MKWLLPFVCFFLPLALSAQPVTQQLQKAFQQFESDSQLKHAISSLYVIDATTGKVVFDKNSQVGLAGASTLNWRENQFDLILRSGNIVGDHVYVVGTLPKLHSYEINSSATSAEKGTGDNAYIYFSSSEANLVVRGTIPVNEEHFKISG